MQHLRHSWQWKLGRKTPPHHSWLLLATAKHRKMHSTHWSNWENEALLLGAKNQSWLIQLKKLPLLHPLTYQLGLFCLGRKLSVNKISVAVMQGISSQRSDRRQEGDERWKRRNLRWDEERNWSSSFMNEDSWHWDKDANMHSYNLFLVLFHQQLKTQRYSIKIKFLIVNKNLTFLQINFRLNVLTVLFKTTSSQKIIMN